MLSINACFLFILTNPDSWNYPSSKSRGSELNMLNCKHLPDLGLNFKKYRKADWGRHVPTTLSWVACYLWCLCNKSCPCCFCVPGRGCKSPELIKFEICVRSYKDMWKKYLIYDIISHMAQEHYSISILLPLTSNIRNHFKFSPLIKNRLTKCGYSLKNFLRKVPPAHL